ncbi:receptor homology region transmembrane domain ring H2 motif protein 1 [Striga asiatica]|uniref:Receptor homology region transmembrane domain ring H2 motif protein 1 n=1 Tax=Striga asiatica TaxID=4170 RepID=A0A5A7Q4N2_STRAF|nr:receptor homology region transmembrane domain ring H2 motif protein 1 [Striga asiatica]
MGQHFQPQTLRLRLSPDCPNNISKRQVKSGGITISIGQPGKSSTTSGKGVKVGEKQTPKQNVSRAICTYEMTPPSPNRRRSHNEGGIPLKCRTKGRRRTGSYGGLSGVLLFNGFITKTSLLIALSLFFSPRALSSDLDNSSKRLEAKAKIYHSTHKTAYTNISSSSLKEYCAPDNTLGVSFSEELELLINPSFLFDNGETRRPSERNTSGHSLT